jgi:hypothetical protein
MISWIVEKETKKRRRATETPFLNLSRLDRSAALFVIILHMIQPSAHGIAPHEVSIVEDQEVRKWHSRSLGRIEPQIVAIWIEDDWHTNHEQSPLAAGNQFEKNSDGPPSRVSGIQVAV